MDLVILAGGRGQRLGALTHKKHKGVLKMAGVPILTRILEQWVGISAVNTIWVVTGYRSVDIDQLLRSAYPNEVATRKIIPVFGPGTTVGTLHRFACALKNGAGKGGAVITGIDTLFVESDINDFVAYVAKSRAPIVISCSKEIHIAPTHPAARMRTDAIIEYRTGAAQKIKPLAGRWYRDTGLRYFSQAECHHLLQDAKQKAYLGEFITAQIASGVKVQGYKLRRQWVHIASPQDFTSSVPI